MTATRPARSGRSGRSADGHVRERCSRAKLGNLPCQDTGTVRRADCSGLDPGLRHRCPRGRDRPRSVGRPTFISPNCFCHRWYVASLMFRSWHTSLIARPSSASRRARIFSSVVCRFPFIVSGPFVAPETLTPAGSVLARSSQFRRSWKTAPWTCPWSSGRCPLPSRRRRSPIRPPRRGHARTARNRDALLPFDRTPERARFFIVALVTGGADECSCRRESVAVGWMWRTLPRTYVRSYQADVAAGHGAEIRPVISGLGHKKGAALRLPLLKDCEA